LYYTYEGLIEALGLRDELGERLALGLSDALGLMDGLTLELMLELGDREADGLSEALTLELILGLIEGLMCRKPYSQFLVTTASPPTVHVPRISALLQRMFFW
jgi:hypothetical protein